MSEPAVQRPLKGSCERVTVNGPPSRGFSMSQVQITSRTMPPTAGELVVFDADWGLR